MSTESLPDVTESHGASPAPSLRRKRVGLRGAFALAVVVGVLGLAGTGCTPKDVAAVAVAKYWEPAQRDCAMRIIERESNYQADAISPNWAIGLFQIHPTHQTWVKNTYGYEFGELTDPNKNSQVARGLSNAAQSYYGDRWQPWRYGGKIIRGGGCPA